MQNDLKEQNKAQRTKKIDMMFEVVNTCCCRVSAPGNRYVWYGTVQYHTPINKANRLFTPMQCS